ncbi:MAG TPA: sulfotransferase [Phycisphaerales bacterium]|nr:sulfotransferase [Phycisphaerales bacterium]
MGQSDAGLRPPIILFGNARSGTTMMRELFDLHPDVSSWYEERTIWNYADPARKHDRFTEEDATPKVRAYIRKRFLQRQREMGGRRVMEKTPACVVRIPYVRAIFPEASFVYIVREPLANLSSAELRWHNAIHLRHIRRRIRDTPKSQLHYYLGKLIVDHFRKKVLRQKHVSVWGVRYPGILEDRKRLSTEEIIARQWAYCSKTAAEDLARIEPGKVHTVRYEDFVTDPATHFARILSHCGLDMTPEISKALSEWVDPGRQNKWKRLDPGVLRTCLPIVMDEMGRHGYQVPDDVLALLESPQPPAAVSA